VRACQQRTDNVNAIFANRRLQLHKRSQLFIGIYNETASIVAMRVNDPNCAPFNI